MFEVVWTNYDKTSWESAEKLMHLDSFKDYCRVNKVPKTNIELQSYQQAQCAQRRRNRRISAKSNKPEGDDVTVDLTTNSNVGAVEVDDGSSSSDDVVEAVRASSLVCRTCLILMPPGCRDRVPRAVV